MNIFLKIFIIFLILLFFPITTFAAEMSFDANGNQFMKGEEFIISVQVDTQGESINTVGGSINLPTDLVSIKEIRDGNSVINFWVERPNVYKSGIIKFAGITPGGFSGTDNILFSVVLTATNIGNGIIYGQNAQSLKNDGLGTNIQIKNKSLPIIIYKNITNNSEKNLIPLDNELPENFTPIIASDPSLFNGKYFLVFATQDKISSVANYKVREGEWGWFSVAESPYLLKNQLLDQKIFIKAIDKSGNERVEVLIPRNKPSPYQSYKIFAIIFVVLAILFARKNMDKIYKIILCFLFLCIPFSLNAATLSFSQLSDSYAVGSTFSVSVYVGSPDQAMNATSGIVSFPWDKLQVVSLSKTGSILSLWAEEPSFSNSSGTVNFEGIILNPGFAGASGKILTINFKAKTTGQANLSFSSGSVLANDGTGTNILNKLNVAVLNIVNQEETPSIPSTTVAPNVSEENAPVITSLTHPDETKWYADNKPEFSWILPKGVLEVRTSISSKPLSVPKVSYIPAISSKKLDAISDGTYYFNLQIRTALGWGGIGHYRVNIDTTAPKVFSINFPHGKKGFEPQPIILFNTTDNESGISHYEVKIGDEKGDKKLERTAPAALSNPYSLPSQYPGEHVVVVTAFDRAGNTTSASSDFIIEAIEAPIITYYPEEVELGDIVKIRGTTYPAGDISITFYQDEKVIHQETARSNDLGDFSSVVTKRLDPGVYSFTVRVTDERGAKSEETSPLTIIIKSKLLTNVITFILDYLSVTILILLLIGGIIGTGIFIWYKFSRLIRRFRRESYEAEKMIEKSFNIFRKDIDTHIDRLKKAKANRKLTDEEILFLEDFEKNLAEAEEIVSNKIQDISHKSL